MCKTDVIQFVTQPLGSRWNEMLRADWEQVVRLQPDDEWWSGFTLKQGNRYISHEEL